MDEIIIKKESIYKLSSTIIVLLLVSTSLLYSYITDYYVGVYFVNQMKNMYISAKTRINVLIYNIASDKTLLLSLDGFTLYTNILSNDETTIVSIHASGVDLYVALISLTSLIVVYELNKKILRYAKRRYYFLVLMLIIASMTLLFPYIEYAKVPLQDAKMISLNKPLRIYESENVGIIDVLKHDSIIYIESKDYFSVAILLSNTNSYNILALKAKRYTTFINTTDEALLLLIPLNKSIENFNFTYRRIELINAGNVDLKALFTILPSATLSIACILLYVLARKMRSETTIQQFEEYS